MDFASSDGFWRADTDDRFRGDNASNILAKGRENNRCREILRHEHIGGSEPFENLGRRTRRRTFLCIYPNLRSRDVAAANCVEREKLRPRPRRNRANMAWRLHHSLQIARIDPQSIFESRSIGLESMLLDKTFADLLNSRVNSLRKTVVAFNENGIPVDMFCVRAELLRRLPHRTFARQPHPGPTRLSSVPTHINGSIKKAHSTRRTGRSNR